MKEFTRPHNSRREPKRQGPQTVADASRDHRSAQDLGFELTEAQQQQLALTEVLQVIGRCKQNPQSVFDTIVQLAVSMCGTKGAALVLMHEAAFCDVAMHGYDHLNLSALHANGHALIEEALVKKMPVQLEDVSNIAADAHSFNECTAVMAMPILLHSDAIGIVLLLHTTLKSFTSSQIRLLTNFADLAAIAIEKARMCEALDARDRELTVALDHQTTTADVLKIIAQSPDKLEPLLEAIASSALRICKASDVVIERLEGDRFYNAAHAGLRMKGLVGLPLPLTRQFPGGRAILDRTRVIIDDLMAVAETEYPDTLALLKINTIRSVAEIPLLSDGKPLGTIAVLRAEYRPFTESEVALLESFADQAAIAIQNARLFTEIEEKGRLLEAVNRHKSQFLATMSHEIRTPMNGIMGMATLLQRTKLDFEQNDFVQTMLKSSESLLSVIDDILDFSKIESGKLELESVLVNVANVAEAALDIVAPVAAKKGIELIYALAPDVPTEVFGDAHRLQQVLLNLLNNAIKFTHSGEVELAIRSFNPRKGAVEISFRVRDTGIGIPPERIDRLFKSFSQVDASSARRFGGTGLGLTISQSLVQMMGGNIDVESKVGAGSVFHFKLQFDDSKTAESLATRADTCLAGKRVLIVDDNEANRQLLVHVLERWNMLPQAFASSQDVLNLLSSGGTADVALVDTVMQELSGIGLVRAIGGRHPDQMLPIILMCALDSDSIGLAHEARSVVTAVVTKPVKPKQLHDALVQCFSAVIGGKPKSENIASIAPRTARHPLRILLVDDHATNRKFGAALLKQLGYTTDVASSGAEAIALCNTSAASFDVILMDIEMPEMDGIEAIRSIRTNLSHHHPFCIALTANAIVGDREKYLASGFDDYVPKPIRVEVLEAALGRAHERIGAGGVK